MSESPRRAAGPHPHKLVGIVAQPGQPTKARSERRASKPAREAHVRGPYSPYSPYSPYRFQAVDARVNSRL